MKISKIFIIIILLSITSCSRYWYKPYGVVFNDMPKGGTPGFNLGWRHGCESGLALQFGGAIYMTFYSWHKDVDIISTNPDIDKIRKRYGKELDIDWNNPEVVKKNFSDYKNIFAIARSHCKYAVFGTMQLAQGDPPLPGESRYEPGAWSLRNIYTLEGRGDTRWAFW